MKQLQMPCRWWVVLWRALLRCPSLSFLVVFIGMPAITLLGVAAAVYAIVLPICYLMGWV